MHVPSLRPATLDDLATINAIYNHYVLTSTATYQTAPETEEARQAWFRDRDPIRHPVMIVELESRPVAWGSLSSFGKREAFARTVENSIYIHPDFQRRGLGSLLLQNQIQQATAAGHHAIVAAISGDQPGSLALHAVHGFTETGRLREVGWKFGQWLDLVYLQRIL